MKPERGCAREGLLGLLITPELGTASINPGCGGTLCEIKGCPVGKPRTPLELVVTLADAFKAA